MTSMRLKPTLLMLALVVLCWPAPALANVGTPLMWANMFHLVFGNALIGWLEGWVLVQFFGAPRKFGILLMVAANYISMTAGLFGFPWLMNRFGVRLLGDEPLYHVGTLLLFIVIAAFVASLIIEWPFCFAALRGGVKRFTRSWKASALVQTISYALLIPLYALVSPVSLSTDVGLDRSLSFVNTPNAWAYFVSPNDGDVYRIRPDGTDRERVLEADVNEPEAVLMLRWNVDDARWDLWVTSAHESFDERLLVQGLPVRPVESFRTLYERRGADRDSLRSWGPALDLRPIPPHERTMQLWISPWHGGSLSVSGLPGGSSIRVAMHTPLLNWTVRNATLVTDELAIFQLEDQVVAMNPTTRKMGLVTLGRGPLVILEELEVTAAR